MISKYIILKDVAGGKVYLDPYEIYMMANEEKVGADRPLTSVRLRNNINFLVIGTPEEIYQQIENLKNK